MKKGIVKGLLISLWLVIVFFSIGVLPYLLVTLGLSLAYGYAALVLVGIVIFYIFFAVVTMVIANAIGYRFTPMVDADFIQQDALYNVYQ